MQASTVVLIIIAAIVAFGIVFFQYYYKTKKRTNQTMMLSFLRFISLFALGFLLINPQFTKNEYTVEKANLVLLSDNSASAASSSDEIANLLNAIDNDQNIENRFHIDAYTFGKMLKVSDSFSFDEKYTNVSKALKELNEIYKENNTAIVLISDGNQNLGEDYQLYANNSQFPVYPIAIGDTTQYEDLRIDNVTANKFAFLKNKYPIEIDLSYFGNANVATTLHVLVNGKNVYREYIQFSKKESAKTIQTLLNATTVGVKKIEVRLNPIEKERNRSNNNRNLAIEVIDEKTNIAIVTDIMHPDIGALKKSIESNEQRSVVIKKPNANLEEFENIDVLLLYQPSPSFKPVYDFIQRKKSNYFTIIGEENHRNFLNSIQNTFTISGDFPIQETFAVLNEGYSKFDISDFGVADLPPVFNTTGPVTMSSGEALLQMKILGKTFDAPLLQTSDSNGQKEVVFFGENIWKWRVQNYREQQNFENFDHFIGKLIRYLSSGERKNRLNLEYEAVYNGSTDVIIRASYFDEAFLFDRGAKLLLKIKNNRNDKLTEIPMLLKTGFFEADLSSLPSGDYSFSVQEMNHKISKSGQFVILDFDIEKQFTSTNYKKLDQLAVNTGGILSFPNTIADLIQNLDQDKRYLPTQKGTKNIVSLIDFRIILALIAFTLTLEWLIRKYNGLT